MTIHEAIAEIMREGYAIGKNSKNQQQGFMYRGIDAVMNTFQPLLAARGVFVVPEVLEQTREERQTAKGGNLIYSLLKVKYTFYASDGSSVSAIVIGEGMDSADKASNKAMSVAFKYALFQVFCIPTEEMRDADPDGTTPEESKPVTVKFDNAIHYCADCGAPITDFGTTKKTPAEKIIFESAQKTGREMCGKCLKAWMACNTK